MNIPSVSLDQLRRVRKIRCGGLFGVYDHELPLSLDSRVTIIHGANGVGKTILLRLTHALFSQNFAFHLSIPYDEFEVTLEDDSVIKVVQERVREESSSGQEDKTSLTINIRSRHLSEQLLFRISLGQLDFDAWAERFESSVPWMIRSGSKRFYDSQTDISYTPEELWRTFGEDQTQNQPPLTVDIPPEAKAFLGTVKTHFIETTRLERKRARGRAARHAPTFSPAVLLNAGELLQRLRGAFSQYGQTSQQLDQTFPQRLFQAKQTMTKEQIKIVLKEIEEEQNKLQRLGVLAGSNTYGSSLSVLDEEDSAKLVAMELFVKDSKVKLRLLGEFASRVEPLLSSINGKFKNKEIRLDRERGLLAWAANGAEIQLDLLSSGEQHEIVVLYDLLFRLTENTLVLIDEPELSLHIDWQRRFLPELLNIAATTKIDALVATHSPSVVGERDDLMVALDSSR